MLHVLTTVKRKKKNESTSIFLNNGVSYKRWCLRFNKIQLSIEPILRTKKCARYLSYVNSLNPLKY